MNKNLLSIVVPCYNEEETIRIFYDTVIKELRILEGKIFIEFLFIDDGSKDKTLLVLQKLHEEDDRVRYISFSRNFGKEAAILAGIEESRGDIVVLMDVDLQDPPELLVEMYTSIVEEGYDSVATYRKNREGEPKIRSFFAKCFYKIINKISETDIVDGARDYRMMKRSVVNAILDIKEYNRFTKGIFGWVGYRTKWIAFENVERIAGTTKWSFWKLFLYSLEGITAFSTLPLVIASVLGGILCMVAVAFIFIVCFKTLVYGEPVAGWPSLICLILLASGIQLLSIGILGQYLAKMYLEVKHRPHYIIRETENGEVKNHN